MDKGRAWDSTIVFDLQHVQSFTLGDTDLEAEVLDIFLRELPGYLAYLAVVSVAEWPDAVHKVKGAARGIGAWKLADLAADYEEQPPMTIESDPQRHAMIEKLMQAFEETKAQITQHLSCD